MRRDLPTGTVTFLFTDIDGSTRLLHELGDGYADVLAEHRRAVRDAFARHGGVEVDTQGDAFFYAFARATDAAAAALAAQRALEQGPVRVRMGLHTGEPMLTDEGYVGVDVHRGARIMAAGHGGQVLVSEATRNFVGAELPLRDLGAHRFKDLEHAERVYQLGDGSFPPLRSLNNTNLPLRTEPLLGRKREAADLLRLLRVERARAITLTGPGGIGKTRLAQETAYELVEDFADGVWFVDLSGVRDPRVVLATIGGVVGANGDVADHFRDRSALLVLDNFEQVIAAAADVARVLAASPRVALLVTSREPLRIEGEREYGLAPLAEAPAVELFRTRASASGADVEAPYATLAQLCRRLDSLPLAIELAAARTKTLTLDALASRLEQRLPLLTKGRRDAPERQRTLRATIEWSYGLLDVAEQRLFARLAVFAGGSTLEAAETVCGADVDLLDSLVDKSLVLHEAGRFSMLETIREFAAERLESSNELETIRRRHAEFVLALADGANLRIEKSGPMRHELVIPERDNIRAALEWTSAANDIELGARILFELENYWVTAGSAPEGYRWATRFLESGDAVPAPLRAALLRVCGNTTAVGGDAAAARRYYERSAEEYRKLGDLVGVANMLVRVAIQSTHLGERARARRLVDESVALIEDVSVPKLEPQALTLLAHLEFEDGRYAEAIDLLERAAASAEATGFTWFQSNALGTLAARLLDAGEPERAAARAREALVLDRRMGDRRGIAYTLALLATCELRSGRPEVAGRLWGAVEAEEERAPAVERGAPREQFGGDLSSQGDGAFEEARRAGRSLTLEEAVEEALRV